MFVPFISKRSESKLFKRKGGGGKGGGSSSGGAKSSGSGSSGSSAGKSGGTARSSSISSGGTTKAATSYGSGGGKVVTIPSGQLFAGRTSGGGTRSQVVGTRTYGSGYPGLPNQRGVASLGFPFIFWPLAWGGIAGIGTAAYLHSSEYGRFDNSSRPGGIMMTAAFTSSSPATTFRIVSDNTTVQALIQDITANCSSSNLVSPDSIVATTYNDSLTAPVPEQVVQYYRASTVALSLDGYNDTAALDAPGEADTSLPTNIDTTLLNCLNQTIAAAAPLVDGGLRWTPPPTTGLIGVAYLVWSLSSLF